jgi:hypothetical protein
MWPFTRRFAPITHIPDNAWSVAVSEHEGQPLYLRINTWARKIRGHPDYPWRIGIAAPVPPNIDLRSLNEPASPFCQLEDRADAYLESNFQSIHLLTLTCSAFRELVYHTKDPQWAQPRLDALCKEFRAIKAASVIESDPKWASYTRFCGRK